MDAFNLNTKLTKKEQDIVAVLWDAGKPLCISEICEHAKEMNMELNQSTVQVTAKKLLQGGVLRVGAITQVNKVLARAYEPAVSADEFAVLKMKEVLDSAGRNKISSLMAALLEHEAVSDDDLDELAAMIKEMREK